MGILDSASTHPGAFDVDSTGLARLLATVLNEVTSIDRVMRSENQMRGSVVMVAIYAMELNLRHDLPNVDPRTFDRTPSVRMLYQAWHDAGRHLGHAASQAVERMRESATFEHVVAARGALGDYENYLRIQGVIADVAELGGAAVNESRLGYPSVVKEWLTRSEHSCARLFL
jgi:hypothetical protein